jgi:hypothetical protein
MAVPHNDDCFERHWAFYPVQTGHWSTTGYRMFDFFDHSFVSGWRSLDRGSIWLFNFILSAIPARCLAMISSRRAAVLISVAAFLVPNSRMNSSARIALSNVEQRS